ncbi:MAG: hypothetical protein EA360_01180 [Balneolaceae bacterium]|nr:MAG: hypothetical protein EA360_01180 [Balneolaceae bacterium]
MTQDKVSPEVLASGKRSFKIEVPYTLMESGRKGIKKPLILYLHGFGGNEKKFKKKCEPLFSFEAYHLFIQGPYPVFDPSLSKTVSNWGRAWYLYDGRRKQFIKSLELSSEFIQEIIDNLIKFIQVEKMCVIGYSMGGYLAGYFALTRWKHVNQLIVSGARIKTEVMSEERWKNLSHMDVLALHGRDDETVSFENQRREIETLKSRGVRSEFRLLNQGHEFNTVVLDEIGSWMKSRGYKKSPDKEYVDLKNVLNR